MDAMNTDEGNSDYSLPLNDDWRVSADAFQWMLQKRVVSKGNTTWVSHSYIASNKDTLLRVITEQGIPLATDVLASINDLPVTFREFQGIYHTRSGRGRSKKTVSE